MLSQQDYDNIFKQGYRGHNNLYEGTGLGLNTASRAITKGHGRIDVSTRQDNATGLVFTVFTIRLPAKLQAMQPHPVAVETSLKTSRNETHLAASSSGVSGSPLSVVRVLAVSGIYLSI